MLLFFLPPGESEVRGSAVTLGKHLLAKKKKKNHPAAKAEPLKLCVKDVILTKDYEVKTTGGSLTNK